MSFRGGGTAGGGKKGSEGPRYVRHIPKFLQPYAHMLEKGDFRDEAEKAWSDYAAAPIRQKFDDGEAEEEDWREGLDGATVVGGDVETAKLTPKQAKEEAEAAKSKEKGNTAFAAGKHDDAIRHFSRAITLTPTNHVLYSNRSAAHSAKKEYTEALADARKVVELKADWAKGYARLGEALFGLKSYEEALAAYEKGFNLDSSNGQLADAVRKVRAKVEAEEKANEAAGKHKFKKRRAKHDEDDNGGPSGEARGSAVMEPPKKQGRSAGKLLSFEEEFGDDTA
eukprot:TRINITY_DN1441_c0_g1_i1.p1 TRINITY_DN1441_c0_g1~~TRINITY_DN1441_c0_g1_i1.p1  ORF type:complete len:282 (+),score=84.03 TRINITY_DN1441_c0_g1_i1:88-933(+)